MARQAPEIEDVPRADDTHILEFTASIASRGFHVYKATDWTKAEPGERVTVERETSAESLKIDRFSCAVCRLKKEGVFPVKVTCGHIPLEVSKLCHYFMVHGGLITGAVEDAKPRRSPIPSGGQEIKLRLTFRAVAPLADKMKVLLRQQYNFEFDCQQQGDINNDNGGDISDNENENTL